MPSVAPACRDFGIVRETDHAAVVFRDVHYDQRIVAASHTEILRDSRHPQPEISKDLGNRTGIESDIECTAESRTESATSHSVPHDVFDDHVTHGSGVARRLGDA